MSSAENASTDATSGTPATTTMAMAPPGEPHSQPQTTIDPCGTSASGSVGSTSSGGLQQPQPQPQPLQQEKANNQAPKLAKLSAADFRRYNSLAETMDQFHNHFRLTWNELYDTACGRPPTHGSRKPTPRQFIDSALAFLSQLTMHHGIEERYFFPRLAARMPAFQDNDELKTHHERIHEGMDELERYLKECKCGERDLRMEEVKIRMDSWKEVLWLHLEREVKELGAENMRKYWTLEEMRRLELH